MHALGLIILLLAAAYALGFYDGLRSRPPDAMRGNYDSGEHDNRVEDYPDYWE